MNTQSIEIYHMSGVKYTIIDIPILKEKWILLEYYLQMLINHLENRVINHDEYSFSEFVINELGIEVYTHLISSSVVSIRKAHDY
ncbi:DUF2535 family protein [Alkalihalobacterium alkalinitrilicum]|uniref:DUF2535 family protein n=1 Tax=Alkalihalobacterium alkalinitrilicum TaxID=427920 RepID=UPI001150B74A|nr:DUF2535 family protein [Alkalihalobacterium alkalinitrilicum]